MKLPIVSGHKIIKALKKIGFEVVGQKGSHVRLKRRISMKVWIVVVPLHKELSKSTLKSILRRAELTRDELKKLLK